MITNIICKRCNESKDINCFQVVKIKRIDKQLKEKIYLCRRKTCIKCMNDTCTKNNVLKNKKKYYFNMNLYLKKQRENNTDIHIKALLRQQFGLKAKNVNNDLIILKRKEYVLRKRLKQNN